MIKAWARMKWNNFERLRQYGFGYGRLPPMFWVRCKYAKLEPMDNKDNFQNKIRELRELIDSSICYKQGAWSRKESGDWSKLWTAVDSIKDTQSVIEEFLSLKIFSQLAIYGLLQSLVVQQDGLKHLEEAIKIEVPNFKQDYPDLYKIREIRNETIGHPTETKRKGGLITHTSISRTNSLNALEYGVWSKDGFEPKSIDLKYIINTQQELLIKETDRVIAKIKEEEGKHRKKFENGSLQKMLHITTYLASKAYSSERDSEYAILSIDSLTRIYNDFKQEICSRYKVGSIDETIHVPGLVGELEQIDKVLPRVHKMLSNRSKVDELDLDVYAESLNNSFRSLQTMAREIDEEFDKK